MSTTPSKIGMAPPRPGEFIRDEIFNEFDLSISEAAEVLGVRRATLSDLVVTPKAMRSRAGEIDVKRYNRPPSRSRAGAPHRDSGRADRGSGNTARGRTFTRRNPAARFVEV